MADGLLDKAKGGLGNLASIAGGAAERIGEAAGDAAHSASQVAVIAADAAIKGAKSVIDKAGAPEDGQDGKAIAADLVHGAAGAVTSKVDELTGGKGIKSVISKAASSRDKREDMIFKSGDSLQQVVNVVNEAAAAIGDKGRTIAESSIPEVLAAAVGAGVGGVGSFAALYGLGAVGLSAAGITSGLATAGAVVGGGMVAGVFVLAAPVAALAAVGVGTASHLKNKQLRQEKERLYKVALEKHQAIIKALKEETGSNKERIDYLQSLNVLLERAVRDLQHDLNECKAV